MTSYLRSFFGYGGVSPSTTSSLNSSSSQSSSRSKPHSRSNSASAAYIYAAPSSTMSSTSSRPSSKRSNSYSASRTAHPSPLRYATYENASTTGSVRSQRERSLGPERTPLYRRASYKTSEHSHYPVYAPSVSFSSSRSNSSSSIYPGSHHSATPVAASSTSSHRVRYSEPRPKFKQNHTWHGSLGRNNGELVYGPVQAHQYPEHHHSTPALHMHPLLAATRLHSAPISYDVLFTPSERTVLDRTTRCAVPSVILSQPASDPPTSSASRLVLRSDKLLWSIVVGNSGSRFYLGNSTKHNAGVITNLDVLYAIHTNLLTRVTPQEWESLGHGSRAQRKVTRAYEKRCTRMGGGWEGGVRRIDWLGGKTRLVGIEVDKHESGIGKLVFGKA